MMIEEYFSSYFIVLSLIVGVYMLLVQGPNLIKVNHLDREGRFLKGAGRFYIVVGIVGIVVRLI